jgi:PII-like signaling protein
MGLSVDNLIQILMQTLMHEGGPMKSLIGKKLMNFGVDGVFVFQGTKSCVIIQFVNG